MKLSRLGQKIINFIYLEGVDQAGKLLKKIEDYCYRREEKA
ncbi:hypothetical protein Xen7305DRAFT_00049910 [Xenococcus sp. PCC 7305]|nr:hypothetical protein Xen7305DRAFT_00049910 [Xenococcus sp. PCC 7305]